MKDILSKLCWYDERNPDYIDKDNNEGKEPRKDCFCDNCFNGRDKLAVYILELEQKNKTQFDIPEVWTDEKRVVALKKARLLIASSSDILLTDKGNKDLADAITSVNVLIEMYK